MFANDKSIDNLEALFKEIKKYIELQGQYIKLDLVEKLTILISTLILICVLIVLGMTALFYFSFMLVYDRLIRKQYNSQLCHYWRMYINSWNSNLHFQTKDNLSAYGKLSGQTFPGRQGQRKQ